MAFGLPVSLVLHGALLAWAIFVATTAPLPKTPEETPVEVALISVKDFETRQKKGDIGAKQPDSAPQPKPAEVVATQEAPKPKPPPPAPPPAAAEPPPPADPIAEKIAALPEPIPAPPPKAAAPPPPEKDPIAEALALEQAKAKQEAEAKAAAEAQAAAEAKARKDADDKRRKELADKKKREDAEKKRLAELKKKQDEAKKFDPGRIAAAIGNSEDPPPKELDKDPTKRPGGAPAPSDALNPSKNKGPSAGTKDGKDNRLTATEKDMIGSILNRALAPCWRHLPGGNPSEPSPDVEIGWTMSPDGSLNGEPRVITRISSPALQDAADRAVRAVIGCAPYKLPPELYQHWRSLTRVFEPPK